MCFSPLLCSRHPGCLLGLQCFLFASRHDPYFSLSLSPPHNWPSKLLSVPEASFPPSGHLGLPHSSIFPRSKPRALHVSSHEGWAMMQLLRPAQPPLLSECVIVDETNGHCCYFYSQYPLPWKSSNVWSWELPGREKFPWEGPIWTG